MEKAEFKLFFVYLLDHQGCLFVGVGILFNLNCVSGNSQYHNIEICCISTVHDYSVCCHVTQIHLKLQFPFCSHAEFYLIGINL